MELQLDMHRTKIEVSSYLLDYEEVLRYDDGLASCEFFAVEGPVDIVGRWVRVHCAIKVDIAVLDNVLRIEFAAQIQCYTRCI